MAAGEPRFSWRRVVPADFPLLAQWLAEPHVARWWNHETAPRRRPPAADHEVMIICRSALVGHRAE